MKHHLISLPMHPYLRNFGSNQPIYRTRTKTETVTSTTTKTATVTKTLVSTTTSISISTSTETMTKTRTHTSSRTHRTPTPTGSHSPTESATASPPPRGPIAPMPTTTTTTTGIPLPTKIPDLPPGLNYTMPAGGAFNRESYTIWVGVFALFFVWWVIQVITYASKARTPAIALAIEERAPVAETWTRRLQNASRAGRDSFLVLLGAAMIATAVGATFALEVLSWVFVLLSVIWILSALFVVSDAIHGGLMIIAIPFGIVVYLLTLIKS
ncbi:hypothetical protein SeMB42_g07831 [Synchytrium endobioticum]|uniref:Uncharacterized protein n=1 Tax=Synchytrium endobioticum TaxID=286115 RepID=A0A507CYA7_9FUNG|nr:hypothetical protein SeMB42_g07831 [Synchytrium endobioticum]TPX43890.1 hypothetical protein SeLEV6574_g04822 [Synchytrium endobioticum]